MSKWIYLFNFLYIVNSVRGLGCASNPGAYGPPCLYLPAKPGETPPCARPGDTYCETIPDYPMDQIKRLIEQYSYDPTALLISEKVEQKPTPRPVYGPPGYAPPTLYGPPGYSPSNLNGASTILTPVSQQSWNNQRNRSHSETVRNMFPGQSQAILTNEIHETTLYNPFSTQSPFLGNSASPSNVNRTPWRSSQQKISRRHIRSKNVENSFLNGTNNDFSSNLTRHKRQLGTFEPLCVSRTEYIFPKTAMNADGIWMYIANIPQAGTKFQQSLQVEICQNERGRCSSICSLPLGYSSRCVQKYTQKKLFALSPEGNRLKNEVFRFPSCCLCEISPFGGT